MYQAGLFLFELQGFTKISNYRRPLVYFHCKDIFVCFSDNLIRKYFSLKRLFHGGIVKKCCYEETKINQITVSPVNFYFSDWAQGALPLLVPYDHSTCRLYHQAFRVRAS